jgi:hypothetical protein
MNGAGVLHWQIKVAVDIAMERKRRDLSQIVRTPLIPVLRHWILEILMRLSKGWEYAVGWSRAIAWLPHLTWGSVTRRWSADHSLGSLWEPSRVCNIPVLYINLAHRTDRNIETLSQLRRMNFSNYKRIDASLNVIGALGCARSHLEALDELDFSREELGIIFEDDIEFLSSYSELARVISDFVSRPGLGILCLAYRLRGPAFRISSNLSLANNIQTTAGYVVKRSAVSSLRKSFLASEKMLESGSRIAKASIDVEWKSLQFQEQSFCIPRKVIARQRQSYSDIAGRIKFYG